MPTENTENIELRELFLQNRLSVRYRIISVGIFLVSFPLLIYFLKLPKKISIELSVLLLFFFLITFIFGVFIRKQKSKKAIEQLNFLNIISDFCFLSILAHFGGGIAWVVYFFSIGSLAYTFIVLPIRESFILTIFLISILIGMGFLEYFGILPHYSIFNSYDLYNNFKYVTLTLLVFSVFLISTSFTLTFFANNLKTKSRLLEEKYKENEDIKSGFEIRVMARKKELEEIAKKLDIESEKRTEDLQGKAKELEGLNKKTVKRELRMLELKREIRKMREAIKEKK